MRSAPTTTGAVAGFVLDLALGEPPNAVHPVAAFGIVMRRVERVTYRDSRAAGCVHLAIGVGAATIAGTVLTRLVGRAAATATAATVCIAGRMLAAEAGAVLDLIDRDDIGGARARLPGLVGRDPSHLDAAEITRAVIESTAENEVDAVTAPILWAVVGGAPGVLVHRAVNTLDAMIGHHDDRYERFGWAAARADDALNWIPARLSAIGVGLLRPSRAARIAAAVRADAPRHPSPNGGVIEAAFAAALDIRLGGTNTYAGRAEHRGVLGRGRFPTTSDGRAAIQLARSLGALMCATALIGEVGGRWWNPCRQRST